MRRQDGVDISLRRRRTILSHVVVVTHDESQHEKKAADPGSQPAHSTEPHFSHCRQFPTIVAPRKFKTWPIGLANATVLLLAKSKPIARGFAEMSWTSSDPESPAFTKPICFFFKTTAPTKIYTLSLHDALRARSCRRRSVRA